MEPTEYELRKLYVEDLLSTVEIGKRYGMSYTSINARLRNYGIPIRPPGTSAESRGSSKPSAEELTKLYHEEKLTTRAIGDIYGISKTEVLRCMKRYNMPRRAQRNGLENRGITPPTKSELEHMVWTEHLPYPDIAAKYGVDSTAVPYWLRKHDIERPKIWDTRYKGEYPPDFNPIDISTRYALGESTTSIAEDYGVRATTLANKMRKEGIPLRRNGFDGGKRYQCQDGHEARSVYEQRVDDWFYKHGIEHECEPRYPWDKRCRADFKVGETYIEIWGVYGNERYNRQKQRKIDTCAELNIPLIQINHWQFAKGRRFWHRLLPLKSQNVASDLLHGANE